MLVQVTVVDGEPAFVFPPTLVWEYLRLGGGVVFIVAGLAFAWWLSAVGLLFVVAGIALGAFGVIGLRRAGGLTLTPTHVKTARGALPWGAVARAGLRLRHTGRVFYDELTVYARPDDDPVLAVHGDRLVASAAVVAEVVNLYRDEPERRAAIGTAAERDRLFN